MQEYCWCIEGFDWNVGYLRVSISSGKALQSTRNQWGLRVSSHQIKPYNRRRWAYRRSYKNLFQTKSGGVGDISAVSRILKTKSDIFHRFERVKESDKVRRRLCITQRNGVWRNSALTLREENYPRETIGRRLNLFQILKNSTYFCLLQVSR